MVTDTDHCIERRRVASVLPAGEVLHRLGTGVQAIQLSPYRAGLAEPALQRFQTVAALPTCYFLPRLSLRGGSVGPEISSESIPTKPGILCRVTRRTVPPIIAPGTAAKRVHRQVVLTRSQAREIHPVFLGFLVAIPSSLRSDLSRVDVITGDSASFFTRRTAPGFRGSPVHMPGCTWCFSWSYSSLDPKWDVFINHLIILLICGISDGCASIPAVSWSPYTIHH